MSRLFLAINSTWKLVPNDSIGIALYSFNGMDAHQISFSVGDVLQIEEESTNWYRGKVLTSDQRGIFPKSYVALKTAQDFDLVTNELTQVIREWGALLMKYYKERKMNEYKVMKEYLSLLIEWHSKIANHSTEAQEVREIKGKVINKIEQGRRLMGLDMIVRTPNSEPAHEKNTGIIQLYRMHHELDTLKYSKFIQQQQSSSSTLQQSQSLVTSPSNQSLASSTSSIPNQIFLDLRVFMCAVGEETELYFSLYNKNEGKFITEEFQVGLTNLGMPHDIEKIGKLSTLFTDISKKELQTELYLVVRLIRKGKMLADSNKKAGIIHYRRPFGVSVLRLTDDKLTAGKEIESIMTIYTSTQETSFSLLHEVAIKNPSSLQTVPKAKGICVALTLLPGDLKSVLRENPELVVQKTNRLGFPEVIFPGAIRNDIFITLESGEYSQDRKTSAKNVEVLVQVRNEEGELLSNALYYGDKLRSEFKSMVYYHTNQPHWSETFRVNLPVFLIDKAYLVFSIRHCTTSENKERVPFAMTYLKLTNPDGTVIANKTHSIPSYKTSKSIEEFLPSLKDPNNKNALRKGENTKVKVLLCSTLLTQNLSLLTLLKWDQYSGDLGEVLNRFTFVDQIEIIKFMQETFNALFAILEAKKISDLDLVFNAITWIIGLLVDEKTSRYTNFKPVLDEYIENHFKSTLSHIHLIGCLKRILTNDNFKTLMSTLKSIEYILKFIVTSKKNHDKINPHQNISFKEDLTSVFNSLSTLMKRTEGNYIGAQTTALKIFNSMFNDLGQLFSIEERGTIARNFVDSVRYDESYKLLNMEKMNVILNLVEGDLFADSSSRKLLIPMVKRHLKLHMSSSSCSVEDTKKYAEIISAIIEQIQVKIKDLTLIWEIVDLLPEIMKSIQSSPWNEFSKLDMIHNLYSIFYLMEPHHYDEYIEKTLGEENCWNFILNVLTLLNQLLSTNSTYPENWLTLSMFQYSIVKRVVIQISKYLSNKTKGGKEWVSLDLNLWSTYFSLANTYFKLKGLALENFSEAKQNTIKSRYGDMRNDLISTIEKMWQSLDRHQIKLLPTVISPFLELMLINQNNLKQLGIELYYQLLKCEFKEYKSFKKVETETINTLDIITNSPEGSEILDEKFRKFFSHNLEEKMASDQLIKDQSKVFISDMTIFLELLYQLRTLPDRPEYEDDRCIAAMKLMSYLKQTDRQDTYTKYVHLLCTQHISNGNFVEAGHTLLLHADLLGWSDDVLEEYGDFKQQTQRERKEKLFKQAIEYFDKGKAWEKAISLMKQLIIQYEEVQFDYQKLADILQQESTFYRKIIGVERFFSEYFRVGYYGKGFDPSIQGKEFIYKGYELERMSDFVQRIQTKFPNAKLLTYTETPPIEILDSNQQFLQIYNVKPISKEQSLQLNASNNTAIVNNNSMGSNKKSISPALQKYRLNNNINTFVYSKPFKKTKTPKGGNEFKDLWIQNNYFTSQDSFPTTHRRSEITNHFEIELSPIDNALNSIIGKNSEIAEMTNKYESGIDPNISPFTMVLKGVIDAAVNGGVGLYKEVFFSQQYLDENPDKKQTIEKLRAALNHQVQVLERGLLVHSKVCSNEMAGLQSNLELLFNKMRAELEL
ncbi:hypothetical protein DICPUDRAFT_27977 [Dictyostelium purpureum]|uniref:SH3 domain-containing protein n=1 Tax=Dictyostelium purpureum TaxID=5786 RepID=F0ZB12_DICPU|nr:uncharacterized protein DICPUDRAFT_27977 [Dictyostelium purpureum]EGC38812.1 hypothetical protein DICPUDRAFT_27977 [Dictyostelium purpureum]|eukprot:XP_003284606.1 hypothetical protein DICPUDRAFT_27977 [Dictyostelium purpureum]